MKTIFRYLYLLMIITSMSLCLAACGDDDEPADSSRHDPELVGKWSLMIVWDPEDLVVSYQTFEFKKDGSFRYYSYEVVENEDPYDICIGNGTWETANGIVYIKYKWYFEDEDEPVIWEDDVKFNYRVTGDKLIFYDKGDSVVLNKI